MSEQTELDQVDRSKEQAELDPKAAATSTTEGSTEESNPHAEAVLKLAAAMLRATLLFGLVTMAVALVVATIWVGTPGLLGALIGGAVAIASSLATIAMMRFCAPMEPTFVMAVALGSYVVKVLVLLGVMTLLRDVVALHSYSLAITMLAVFVLTAAGEVRAFKHTKIPTIIPAGK